jgi:hypothetical protein
MIRIRTYRGRSANYCIEALAQGVRNPVARSQYRAGGTFESISYQDRLFQHQRRSGEAVRYRSKCACDGSAQDLSAA